MDDATDGYAAGDRCELCGRTDVDDQWLWAELRRFGDEDCECDSVELAFCSQSHAAVYLQSATIEWERGPDVVASGVRADRFFLGCGVLAIVLSVIGVVAVIRWIA